MKRRIGREAIELIKEYYENDDGLFGTAYHIAEWLNDEHGIRASYHQAQEWDRTARLERADKLQSTTFPSRRNGFVRQAAPAHGERVQSRETRIQDTTTRLVNDVREAKADAAQVDASAIERAKVTMVETAHKLYEAAGKLH